MQDGPMASLLRPIAAISLLMFFGSATAAECFAQDGARVAVMARTQAGIDETCEQLRALGSPDTIGLRADITNDDEVRAAFRTVDERWGELVTAFVVPLPGCSPDPEALVEHCRSVLAGPKVPRRVEFLTTLPRNAAGKILKRELRKD